MEKQYLKHISSMLGVALWQVEHCAELFEQGSTVPFVSRYRKEYTGGLNETQVASVQHYCLLFKDLAARKNTILASIEAQGKLSPELEDSIAGCVDPVELEDLYLPYRPKRRTRASVAREKGLEPLADAVMSGKAADVRGFARKFLSESVPDVEDAIAGAKDIMAEGISENAPLRHLLREKYARYGRLKASLAKGVDADSDEAQHFANYFRYSCDLCRAASHQVLALLRGADRGVLSLRIEMDVQRACDDVYFTILKAGPKLPRECSQILREASEDAYKRLLHPSIENESLRIAKEKADMASIEVFGANLRELLLAAPLGQKRMMAIDPGFRTGCKVVCLDAQGTLLHNETIYPHPPQNDRMASMSAVMRMIDEYEIEVIAIGNGTAGRETENFIRRLALDEDIQICSVNEDGASIYSASEVGREEFPDHDVTVRGAVSIGRRLMDPLSELVKIDPKSIGVGQYQYDVDQGLLKERLDQVVESCVNSVGVNLNTASPYLLSYVSGIGPALARNIVEFRVINGPFASRSQLLKVPRLGEKAYQQCAGFLRIPGASNPLDNTAVHPERYALVERMASDSKASVAELIGSSALRSEIRLEQYQSESVGMPTLRDIMLELDKPGRDPRESYSKMEFDESVTGIEDLRPGMELPGEVTNTTAFGSFVELGIKQQGLIHVSRSGGRILKVHQRVKVRVLEVDLRRLRISLELI